MTRSLPTLPRGAPPDLETIVVWSSLATLVAILLGEGYELAVHPALTWLVYGLAAAAVLLSVARDVRAVLRSRTPGRDLRRLLPEALLLLPIAATVDQPSTWALFVFVRQALVVVRFAMGTERYQRLLAVVQIAPARVLAFSFLLIIGTGTVLLTFPRATTDGLGVPITDALFTATSATCVTGLSPLNTVADVFAVPTRQTLTTFGQVVLIALVQVGALGIMTISAAMVVVLGRRMRLGSASLMQTLLDESSTATLSRSVRDILLMTLVVEGLGAALLFLPFLEVLGDPTQAAWFAAFHAISAFCNSGFSLFGDGLARFTGDPLVCFTHAGLVIIGGLGFTVVLLLASRSTWRHGPTGLWRNLTLHARIVLTMTAGLLTAGTVLFFFLEFEHSLAGLSSGDKLLASFFHAVSFRNSGFNTVDLSQISRGMLVIACLFMFIGAGSGSTGGGVKVTTIAVLFASVAASLMGRREVVIGRRTVRQEVVTRAISIVSIAVSILAVGAVLLMVTQPHIPFERLLFEAVSALTTTGASLGATSELTPVGKLIVTLLMFVGRLGPLTIALAVGERRSRVSIQFPEARILVG